MSIPVTCRCGQRFAANDSLAGKRVKCPKCGGVLSIPRPAAAEGDAGLGESPSGGPQAASQPGRAPAASDAPLGDSLFGPTPQAGSGPAPWPGPSAWQGQPYQQQPSRGPGRKFPVGLVIAVAGGGAALLLALIVGLAVFLSSSGREDVAKRDSASAVPTSGDAGSQSPGPVASVPAEKEPPRTASLPDRTSGAEPSRPPSSSARSSDAAADQPQGEKAAAAPPKMTPLAAATMQWRASAGQSLRGALPVRGAPVVIYHYSWMCQLLPRLGYQEVYDKFDFTQPWTQERNLAPACTIIPQFLNPADDRKVWRSLQYHGLGLTHFVGMAGVEDQRNVVAAKLPRSDPRAGVFGYDEVAGAGEITDGSSQTIMIIGSGELANPWVQAGGATIRGARQPYFDKISGFGSQGLSQRGALVVMADGSTRFISADIDPMTFRALCTIHGNEAVDLSELGPTCEGFQLR